MWRRHDLAGTAPSAPLTHRSFQYSEQSRKFVQRDGHQQKRKRRIIVRSRPFLWWAFDEHDQAAFDGLQVKIVAEDQSLFLQYGLAQSADRRFLVIGLRHDAAVLHVRCPAFESSPGRVQPSDIHTLIDWAASMPPECAPDDVVHAHSSKEEVPGGDRATRVYGAVLEEVHRCLSTAAP